MTRFVTVMQTTTQFLPTDKITVMFQVLLKTVNIKYFSSSEKELSDSQKVKILLRPESKSLFTYGNNCSVEVNVQRAVCRYFCWWVQMRAEKTSIPEGPGASFPKNLKIQVAFSSQLAKRSEFKVSKIRCRFYLKRSNLPLLTSCFYD